MTAFTVWKFDTPEGAQHAADLLKTAQGDKLVKIIDHAVVAWPVGEKKPQIDQGHEETRHGAGWGAFWGLLLGTVFLVPLLGAAAGGAIGAVSKATDQLGISKEQLEAIRKEVTEGTSALFVVSEEGSLDRLGERFRGVNMKLLETNLTPAERDLLLETFG